MIDKAKNKDMAPSAEIPQDVTITAESRIKNRYHFAGDGKYQAISLVASTIEEATEEWKQKRIPLQPTQPEIPAESAQPEGKVAEEPKEIINE